MQHYRKIILVRIWLEFLYLSRPRIAMEISIREWQSQDLSGIQAAWLDFCRNAARSDMSLKSDSERTMTAWLNSRFKDHEALGFIAETMDAQAGFLIGRIGHWESVPPVVEPRKMGIIDAVYYALEEALRLKEKHGGDVVVVSMGGEEAARVLRSGLAMGADRAIHLLDAKFKGADEFSAASALAKAIQKDGGVSGFGARDGRRGG